MSQHDGVLANQAGAAFRSDANDALAAIFTNHAGSSAPATTYAYQFWGDTTSGWLKQRNAANSGWIKRFPVGTGARVDVASASTIDLDADAVSSGYLRVTGTTSITAVTLTDGQRRTALAGGAFTITHGSSLVVPGAANYTTTAGDLIDFIGEEAGVVRVMIWKGDGTPVIFGNVYLGAGKTITFEGTTDDAYETVLTAGDPTADRTITLPDATGTVVLKDTTDTLTNKRMTSRVYAYSAPGATPTINTDTYDVVDMTAMAAAITSLTTNLSGTPTNGQFLQTNFTDDGTARALTLGASFVASTIALPSTTVISTKLSCLWQWNSTTSKWVLVGKA